jgi:16S rRNA (uracil1498-N3)-methyltransferase
MTVPRVHEPTSLKQLLRDAADCEDSSGLVFWEQGGMPLDDALDRIAPRRGEGVGQIMLLIGPEGGFSEAEVRDAEQHGFIPVTLGRRTLRAETASVVAVALVEFLLRRPLAR